MANDAIGATIDLSAAAGMRAAGHVGRGRLRPKNVAVQPSRVLVVDDDDASRLLLREFLVDAGFVVTTAPNAEAALVEARRVEPDLVLTDLQMPVMHGVELCRRLHELRRDLPVIVMTAHSDMQSVIDSLRAGAEDYLIKPLELDAVLWCVRRTLAHRADQSAHEALYRRLNERLVLSNVRAREHAEAETRQRVQLNMLLENLDEGVIIGDARGQVLMLNQAAHGILGLADMEAGIAPSSLEALDRDGRKLGREALPLARATRGEQFTDYEIICLRPNGEPRHVVFTGASVKDDRGQVAMAIVVCRDVTEVRRLEQQRREYLGLISHDLRAPLSTVLMSLSKLRTLAVDTCTPSGVSAAERAERNVKRMSAMLEDLSEATSLETREVALRRTTCELSELVSGIVDSMDVAAAARVTLELGETPPFRVLADPSRLERVISNLLTNALKYSPEGAPVRVRLATEGASVQLDVVDHGIGIGPEDLEHLFNRYYRTEASKSYAHGSGLGLYIARLIAEAHGGHLEVSSEVGKGSRFRLVLPSEANSCSDR